MAKYRVKNDPMRHRVTTQELTTYTTPGVGLVFDWDGVTLDPEGDIEINGGGSYVAPEYVELVEPEVASGVQAVKETREIAEVIGVEPVSAGKVIRTTQTVEQEAYVLTLSKEEAVDLVFALEVVELDDLSLDLDQLHSDLAEALYG